MLNDPNIVLDLLLNNKYDPQQILLRYRPILTYVPIDGHNHPPAWAEWLHKTSKVVAMSEHGQRELTEGKPAARLPRRRRRSLLPGQPEAAADPLERQGHPLEDRGQAGVRLEPRRLHRPAGRQELGPQGLPGDMEGADVPFMHATATCGSTSTVRART
jgi:hypothetical protein